MSTGVFRPAWRRAPPRAARRWIGSPGSGPFAGIAPVRFGGQGDLTIMVPLEAEALIAFGGVGALGVGPGYEPPDNVIGAYS